VAVIGAGALGLLAVAGRSARAPRTSRWRRATPTSWKRPSGSVHTTRPDGRYEVVVEAAGSASGLARAIDLVAPGGTIAVPGVHFEKVELDWWPLFHREVRLIPSLGYCGHDGGREMDDVAAMLADDPEIARTVITHRYRSRTPARPSASPPTGRPARSGSSSSRPDGTTGARAQIN
jgi:threonine dehydrogenase-like Zn-dependent dehydrogenase